MKITRNMVGLVAVGALAFALGRMTVLTDATPAFAQQPSKDKPKASAAAQSDAPTDPKMQAWMEADQPGANHKVLEPFIGTFKGEVNWAMEPGAPMMKSTGTITRESIFHGRYITESVEATSDMGAFHGLGCMAFNNIDGVYEFAWIDDHSTGIHTGKGTFNPKTKTFTFLSTHRDPVTGHIQPVRETIDISNPDRHVSVGYAIGDDGVEYKNFEGVFERVKE